MHLPGQRHGGDRRDREPAAPGLERPQRKREQHRDRPEQMSAGSLDRAVRSEREREPADERRAEIETERPQPERREATGADIREQDEDVPAGHRPEERLQRPVDGRERPAGEVHPRLDLRLEAVRVEPGRCSSRELVAGEPERVGRLQVVARRHPPFLRRAVAEKAVGLEDGRRGGEQPGGEVEGGG